MPVEQGLDRDLERPQPEARRHVDEDALVETADRAAQPAQPVHGRRGPDEAGPVVRRAVRFPRPRGGGVRQVLRRLQLEHVPRRDDEARLGRARHRLDRENAVAAQREEAVTRPDVRHPQHVGEHAAEDFLFADKTRVARVGRGLRGLRDCRDYRHCRHCRHCRHRRHCRDYRDRRDVRDLRGVRDRRGLQDRRGVRAPGGVGLLPGEVTALAGPRARLFTWADDAEVADGLGGLGRQGGDGLGGLGREGGEEAGERGGVRGHLGGAVAPGVSGVIDLELAVPRIAVGIYRRVLDRPVIDAAQRRDGAGEIEGLVNGQDVDLKAGQPPAGAEQAEIPAQHFLAVALVAQQLASLPRGELDEFGDAHPGADVKPQRQDVGQHARGAQRGGGAAPGHRHAQDDILDPGRPVQVRRGRSDDDHRPALARVATGGREGVDRVRWQRGGAAQCVVGRGDQRLGEPGDVRPVRETRVPVRLVPLERLGLAVAGLLLDQSAERAERRPGAGLVPDQRGVDGRHPLRQQPCAVAVQQDVMAALVPGEPVIGQPQQSRGEQVDPGQVGGPVEVGAHPGAGGAGGVGLGADVDDRKAGLAGRADLLPEAVGADQDPQPQRLALGEGLPHGRAEGAGIDRAGQVNGLAEKQGPGRGAELLRHPYPGLRAGQRKLRWSWSGHARTPAGWLLSLLLRIGPISARPDSVTIS